MKQQISKQQWLDFLSEQKQSGLTVAAFCRDKNINAKNFYNHSLKARRASSKTPPFVKAQLSPDRPVATGITLQHGKTQINLPASVSPQWLAQLLATLA